MAEEVSGLGEEGGTQGAKPSCKQRDVAGEDVERMTLHFLEEA